MKPIKLWWPILAVVLLLQSCATQGTRPPPAVGAVVEVKPASLPPVPTLVRQTEPMPAGHFQSALLACCAVSPPKPTASMTPTPPAAPTP